MGGAREAVVGVVGGSGGVGASTFAAVLAAQLGGAFLIDVDSSGGGIDVLLGIDQAPGARWSGLRLAGGRLDPAALLDGLPRWGRCPVLAADGPPPSAEAVLQILETASSVAPVVLNLSRAPGAERAAALLHCDLVVIVVRADVAGVVAAHAVRSTLPELSVGAVLRRGPVDAAGAAELVGCDLLGELSSMAAARPAPDPGRLPRASARAAAGVLDRLDRRVVRTAPAASVAPT